MSLIMSKHRLIGIIVLAAVVIITIQLLPNHQQSSQYSAAVTQTVPTEPNLSTSQERTELNIVSSTNGAEGEEQAIDQYLDDEAPLSEVKESLPTKETKENPSKQYSHAWVVQLGSYSDTKYANILASKLKNSGYDAFTYKTVVNDLQVVRVYVGPVTSRQEADQLINQLNNAVDIKGIVTRYEVDQI